MDGRGGIGPGRREVLAGGLAGLVASCAPRRDPNALSFWAMSYEGDYSPHLTAAFTARTGIPVDVQSLPWTAAHEKLLTANAGGALPDVLMLPGGWTYEFAMIGALAPVTDRGLIADAWPGSADLLRYGARYYAVPWSVAPQVQFFRRDLLAAVGCDAPPTDWPEWRRMALALKRRRPDDYVILVLLNWWDALFAFASQAGAYMLRDRDTRGNFRSPEFRQALSFYVSLFRDGLAPTALSTEIQDPLAAFATGQFAIFPNGPTFLTDLHRRAAEIPAARWGTMRLPGPRGPGPATGISASLAVSAASRRPREAWALLEHLTSAANELRFQTMIGNLPARTSAWTSPQLTGPVLRAFAEQLRDPAPVPNLIEMERIRIEVQLIAERVVRGLLTEEEGVRLMDGQVDELLAKRRALVEAGRIA